MKILTSVILLVVVVGLLNSCAVFTNHAVRKNCANAAYVYSNLQQNRTLQTYHLSDGQLCPAKSGGFFR